MHALLTEEERVVILVVDDERSVRTSMLRLLGARGHTVFEAASASEALLKAAEVLPRIIFMDLHMQPESGIDAARRIRQHPQLTQARIVGVSATPPESDGSLQVFDKILLKPCSLAQIVETIAEVTAH